MTLKTTYFVGLGASAGGLQPLQQMLPLLNTPDGSVIICQHLSPHHSSMLSEILARNTLMPITELKEDCTLAPGNIYVAPPNKNVELDGNRIKLLKPSGETVPKPNINQFLSSLGQNHGEFAIGVILSGSGSDGAVGMSAIHASGGTCMVQNPKSADYESMPRAAIDTSHIDYIGTPKELADYINQVAAGETKPLGKDSDSDIFYQLLTYLTAITGVDFDNYRSSTLNRRIVRRMSALQLDTIEEYFDFVKQNRPEVNMFLQNAFIHVSYLFREPDAFNLLRSHVDKMLSEDETLKDIRVWVPACAMGEEAVTIAILLEELRRESRHDFDFKIFATDISVPAIDKARMGRFSLDVCNNLSQDLRKEYFIEFGDLIEVKQFIREKIVFSVHNLLTDPPFSRMHVVSCRNLLIYFKSALQEDVINMFNYSLQDNGLLLLGQSESLRDNTSFITLDEVNKLYQKSHESDKAPTFLRYKTSGRAIYREPKKINEKIDLELVTYKGLLSDQNLSALVIDENNNHMFTYGDAENFFKKQQGVVSTNVFDRIVTELRAELRALVFKTRRTLKLSQSGSKDIAIDGEEHTIKLMVNVFHPELTDWVLVTFDSNKIIEKDGEEDVATVNSSLLELEQELSVTRENLQTVVEELETANEQLQVYNEELQSSNEEYQSTNEELQTINEELQSTNEELVTVNEELNQKNREQERLSTDLFNIQESLDLPMFLIDREFRIQRYTKRCSLLADTSTLRIDDVFFAISWLHDMPDLRPLLKQVFEEEKSHENELTIGGCIFRFRVSPYINHQNALEGLVVSFYDITSLKEAQKELAVERDVAEITLGSLSECIIRLNGERKIEYVNKAAEDLLQRSFDDLYGDPVVKHVHLYDENIPIEINELITDCIDNHKVYAPKDSFFTVKRRYGEDTLVEISIIPTQLSKQVTGRGVAITLKDVTERQSHIDTLLWSSKHDSLTGLVNRKEVEQRLNRIIEQTKKTGVESSMLYMDLDQFKVVNDTCGHMAGDQLLKQISELIQHNIRARDTLARLGGDEFALLLERCSLAKAEIIAKQILEQVQGYSFLWEDKIFKVGVSIGLVSINKHTESLSSVLSDSDAACYAAKESGRNQIQVHNEHNDILEVQRAQMKVVSDINEALDNNGMRLYLQKIQPTDCKKSHLHWEVLIRMFNKDGEFILPSCFLPSAERFGLINRIDKWVFKEVVKLLKTYFTVDNMPEINVNVSANTICDDSYLELVEHTLHESKVPFDKICFELTETAAMGNIIKAKRFIKRIRDCGCKMAIDDFGTGMSSLAYLTDLPVNTVKLDGKFIQTLVEDDINQTIVESVTRVAHKMNMSVVAEAVETEEQREMLVQLGVDFLQGFGIQRPIPSEEFISIHREESAEEKTQTIH